MESGRLRDALGDLADSEDSRQEYTADPGGFLGGYGHAGLPDDLVAEAVSNYADVADPAVAEHLAPMVMAHRGAGGTDTAGDPDTGLARLATAPPADGGDLDGGDVDLGEDLATDSGFPDADGWDDTSGGETSPALIPGHGDSVDLDFGHGAGTQAAHEADEADEADVRLDAAAPGAEPVGLTAPDVFEDPPADLAETGSPPHDPAGLDGDEPPVDLEPDDAAHDRGHDLW